MLERKHNSFLILGSPRTGSTLLKFILETHPDVYCYGEARSYTMFHTPHLIDQKPKCLGLHLPMYAETAFNNPYWQNAKILFTKRDPLDTIRSMFFRKKANGMTMLESLRDNFKIERLETSKYKMFNGKTFYEYCAQEIDILDSLDINSHEYLVGIGALYWKWMLLLEHIYKTSGYQVLRVSYEDLVLFTEKTTKTISNFLGIQWHENFLNHYNLPHFDLSKNQMSGANNFANAPVHLNSIKSSEFFFTEKEKKIIYEIIDARHYETVFLRANTTKMFGYGITQPNAIESVICADDSLVTHMDIKDGMHILDVGFGSGRDLKKIKLLYPNTKCTGIDHHQERIKNGKDINARLLLAEASNLPFKNRTFDIAFANSVMCEMTAEQSEKVIKEMKRVAKQVYYTEVDPFLFFKVVKI